MKTEVTVERGPNGEDLHPDEIEIYVKNEIARSGREPEAVRFVVDGEFVDCYWEYAALPFERLRRITGYLVGNMNRWNNAKLAELNDRVKHD